MREQMFKVLGIEPTDDGIAIRNAFVRLARIYHPDRFVGMPPDVQTEAERRMKEVNEAYRFLRSSKRRTIRLPEPPKDQAPHDAWEEARRWRQEIKRRQEEDAGNRARWQHWDDLEQQARERAEWEAALAARLADDLGGEMPPEPEQQPAAATAQRSLLARRLAAARGENDRTLDLRHDHP
jgi:curved DNA-binding protein CbpA